PARLLPEGCAELAEPAVGRRDPQRATGLAFVAGILVVVVRPVDLLRPGERVLARAVRGPEAARVHVPHVERRRALDDPLGDEPARAARAGEPVRTDPRGDPEAADVARAEDELAVRRERLGPVDEPHDAHLL